MKKHPHQDEFETRELTYQGWQKVTQKFINKRVEQMPERLQACRDMDGRMTGY